MRTLVIQQNNLVNEEIPDLEKVLFHIWIICLENWNTSLLQMYFSFLGHLVVEEFID